MKNPYLTNFAAHVALLLNRTGPEGDVRLADAALWIRLTNLLAAPKRSYAKEIVGAPLMGLGGDSNGLQEAAARWFEQVCDRPLEIRAGYGFHQAHALFAAMAGRAPGARSVELVRGERPAGGATPETLRHAAERLSEAAAATDDPSHGQILGPKGAPLWLRIDEGAFRLPLDLSLWGALNHAPRIMRLLDEETSPDRAVSERQTFIHLCIRAFEAANAHWGRAVALGVSPWDHRDVTTNQMMRLHSFVLEAGGRRPTPTRAALERAWAIRPVPRFEGLDDFLKSEVAQELFFSSPRTIVSYKEAFSAHGKKRGASSVEEEEAAEEEEPAEAEEEPGPPPDPETVGAVIEELFARGWIDQTDRRIYLGLMKREKDGLKRIWRQAWAQEAFPEFADLLNHADKLVGRVAQAVNALRDGVSPRT